MNRIIKFRAWDLIEQKFIYFDLGDCFNLMRIEPVLPREGDDFFLQQFTGLIDSKGKEVFEGDIVKCQQGCPHEVVWDEEIGGTYGGGMPGWCLKGLHKNTGVGYTWTKEEEIIGNIYEHPNLLK